MSFFKIYLFIYFLERGREGEREKYRLVASHGGLNLQPRLRCPDQEPNGDLSLCGTTN